MGAILVVDDEPAVLRLVASVLKKKGYIVHAAANAECAAELFGRHGKEVSLLLTDLAMPRKDGYELARELRAVSPSLPVLFMTGNYENWRHKLGPSPCICKPFELETLLREVNERLQPPAL